MKTEEIQILSFLRKNKCKLLSKSQQKNTNTKPSLSIDKNIPSQQKCNVKNNIYENLRSKRLKMELQLCEIQKLLKIESKAKNNSSIYSETNIINQIFCFFYQNCFELFNYHEILEKLAQFVFCDVKKLEINPFMEEKTNTKNKSLISLPNNNNLNPDFKEGLDPQIKIQNLILEKSKLPKNTELEFKITSINSYFEATKIKTENKKLYEIAIEENLLKKSETNIMLSPKNKMHLGLLNEKQTNFFFQINRPQIKKSQNEIQIPKSKKSIIDANESSEIKDNLNTIKNNSKFSNFLDTFNKFDFETFSGLFKKNETCLNLRFIPFKFVTQELVNVLSKTRLQFSQLTQKYKSLKSEMKKNSENKIKNPLNKISNSLFCQIDHSDLPNQYTQLRKNHFDLISLCLLKNFELIKLKDPYAGKDLFIGEDELMVQDHSKQLNRLNEDEGKKWATHQLMLNKSLETKLENNEERLSALNSIYAQLENTVQFFLTKIQVSKTRINLNTDTLINLERKSSEIPNLGSHCKSKEVLEKSQFGRLNLSPGIKRSVNLPKLDKINPTQNVKNKSIRIRRLTKDKSRFSKEYTNQSINPSNASVFSGRKTQIRVSVVQKLNTEKKSIDTYSFGRELLTQLKEGISEIYASVDKIFESVEILRIKVTSLC